MIKKFFFVTMLLFAANLLFAQSQPLPMPSLTIKNINNKIIISWINNYEKPITALNIQRSYDSLKNYSTIGSVLSPQSKENGYTDANAPYNKMYYRIFIAFEGGAYLITRAARPVKELVETNNIAVVELPFFIAKDSAVIVYPPAKHGVTYPSSSVFTAKDNNIIIHLLETDKKRYSIKFFDEAEKFLFEITKLKEEFLIIEKVNFIHTGWFRFELYENGKIIENNKFQITKELKKL